MSVSLSKGGNVSLSKAANDEKRPSRTWLGCPFYRWSRF